MGRGSNQEIRVAVVACFEAADRTNRRRRIDRTRQT
jgi:hypothetical protein